MSLYEFEERSCLMSKRVSLEHPCPLKDIEVDRDGVHDRMVSDVDSVLERDGESGCGCCNGGVSTQFPATECAMLTGCVDRGVLVAQCPEEWTEYYALPVRRDAGRQDDMGMCV